MKKGPKLEKNVLRDPFLKWYKYLTFAPKKIRENEFFFCELHNIKMYEVKSGPRTYLAYQYANNRIVGRTEGTRLQQFLVWWMINKK